MELPSAGTDGPRQWTVLSSGRITRSWAVLSVALGTTAIAAVTTSGLDVHSRSRIDWLGPVSPPRHPRDRCDRYSLRHGRETARRTRWRGHSRPPRRCRARRARSLWRVALCPRNRPPALAAAVAPGSARDLPSAGEGSAALDLPYRGPDWKGNVDLGVGQHRRRRRRRNSAASRLGGAAPAVGPCG